ncbi:MAG: hypothetical protein UGF89_07690 [Acutalibacteraceae bacterium]|nr:hypothetical protein [Acutalibacteraceae bacterium]
MNKSWKILKAAVEQEILFPNQEALNKYLTHLGNKGLAHELVTEHQNADGTISVVLRKRYNPGNEYFSVEDVRTHLLRFSDSVKEAPEEMFVLEREKEIITGLKKGSCQIYNEDIVSLIEAKNELLKAFFNDNAGLAAEVDRLNENLELIKRQNLQLDLKTMEREEKIKKDAVKKALFDFASKLEDLRDSFIAAGKVEYACVCDTVKERVIEFRKEVGGE